jgi:hypothetical protein
VITNLSNFIFAGACSTLYPSTYHSPIAMSQADHTAIQAGSYIERVKVNSGCIFYGYLATDLTVEIVKVRFTQMMILFLFLISRLIKDVHLRKQKRCWQKNIRTRK